MYRMDFFYNTVIGRLMANIFFRTKILNVISKYLYTKHSNWMVNRYINKYNIDMMRFEDREYSSFADFFVREKRDLDFSINYEKLISPCDGLLSVYEIEKDSSFIIKGVEYTLDELLPHEQAVAFKGGLCLVFRLEAKDYHHFCYIDDCIDSKAELIPGKLHSVQPIAIKKVPVFRQNKRYYHIMDTVNLGKVMQIEVGAVLVGNVCHEHSNGLCKKGQKAGKFELCGSTIILLLTNECKNRIVFHNEVVEFMSNDEEYPVEIASEIGSIMLQNPE